MEPNMETLTQTINIVIGGDGTGSLADTGVSLLPLIAIAVMLIASGILSWRFAHRSHKLSFRSLGVFAFFALAGLGLTLNLSAVTAAPTLTLGTNQDTLTVTVPEGGGEASTTTTLTSGTTNPEGYTLTAALAEAEPGIAIKLKGGDITTSTALEPGAPALTLKTTESASSNDTTEVTLDFTIDGTVTSGTKELKLAYTVTDNEPTGPATLQSFTTEACDALPVYTGSNEDAVITLTDSRDDQAYQVAKLADNNCWMLDNLKLGSTTGTIELTPEDSNVGSNFTLPQLYSGYSGDYLNYDDPHAYGPLPGDTGEGETNYGYLYNWPAATAGETRDSHDETAGDAPYSICPAGWRLPTSRWDADWENVSGDFPNLDIAFGGTGEGSWSGEPNIAQWQYDGPFKGVFAGSWWGGFLGQGDYGAVWSSSAYPDDPYTAFDAYFSAGVVNPASNDARVAGLSVRCLLN